jgi:uncharacterized membrane protein
MESKTKFMGHPVHPMLIVFPLGLLSLAVVFDILYLITGNTLYTTVSYYDIIAGVIGGLAAAVFGFRDWLAIPADTRAKSVGGLHGLGNAVIVILFLASWLLRMDNPNFVPSTFAFILSLVGVLLAVFTGWLGGELVDRLGVGVDQGANLNATSSLSGKPAASEHRSMQPGGVPVTGAEKYREKHIEKGFPKDSEAPLNTGHFGNEPRNFTDEEHGSEHDNLD